MPQQIALRANYAFKRTAELALGSNQVFAPQPLNAALAIKGKTVARQMSRTVVTLAYALIIATVPLGCGGSQSDNRSAALMQLPEGKLAALDANSPNITESMVQPYRSVLDALQQKCSEARDRIGDFSVVGVGKLREKGTNMTIRDFLLMMGNTIPPNAPPGSIKCAEIASAIVVLYK